MLRPLAALAALAALQPACSRRPATPPVRDDAGPAAPTGPAIVPQAAGPVDASGDPLPTGAIARLGSMRFLDRGLERMVFVAGGKELVSSSVNGYSIWDAASGHRVATLDQPDPGPALAVSPSGRLLATQVSDRGKAQLWDLVGRKALAELSPGREVTLLCFPDDETVVTGSEGLIAIWKLAGGEPHRLTVASSGLSALGCGKDLVVWGDDGGKVFTAALAGDAPPVLLGSAGKRITALAPSPDGDHIAAGADDGNIYVWARAVAGPPTVIQAHDRLVASVAWAGEVLWSSGGDAWLRSWRRDGTLVKELEAIAGLSQQFLAVGPDGRRAATWALHRGAKGSEAGRFWLWDLATGDVAAEPERHAAGLTSIDFSPDGSKVVTAGEDNTVRLWAVPAGAPGAVLTAHEGVVNAVRFSSDGKAIYSAGADAYLNKWRWQDDQDDKVLGPIGGKVNAFSLAADGMRIFTGDEVGRVWGWDVAQNAKLQAHDRRTFASVTGLALSPDGKLLAMTGSERMILVVDLGSGGEAARLEPDVVSNFAAAFAPDGKLLATAGDDGRVRLWDATTWKEVRALEGHDGTVRCLAFARDGTRLVSGGNDGTARLWQVADGKEIAVFSGHGGAITGVALAPDGSLVATASQDRTGLVWKAP